MTLHDTTELVKKAGIGSVVGVVGIILIVILFRVGVSVKNTFFPPKKNPPTQLLGALPSLQFPKSVVAENFTYSLQTTTGKLPVGLPDRLGVFPIVHSEPNFLNLEKAKRKVAALGFVSQGGLPLPEIKLDNPSYEWDELIDFRRKIIFNINSFDFRLTSSYLSSLIPLSAQHISDEPSAIGVAKEFLTSTELMPTDVDLSKTDNPDNPAHHATYPQLFSIQSDGQVPALVRTTSLSKTHVIRVDFYQKDVEYDLDSGLPEKTAPKVPIKLPIVYPNPPYSTMSFWVASGPRGAMVTQAFFTHQTIGFTFKNQKGQDVDLLKEGATYSIKTVEQAFEELQSGNAYVAAFTGPDTNILIKEIYLAYYLGETPQQFLMPVYVFEGNDGFFGYISAVTEDQTSE